VQSEPVLSSQVAALFADPKHAGRPESGSFRHGRGGAVKTGTLIELWLSVQNNQITAAHFEVFGCPSAIACAEWLCRWLIGRDTGAAAQLTGLDLAAALALAAEKRSVALLTEDALKAALTGSAHLEFGMTGG